MSRITIVDYEANAMVLDDWLEAHKLDIRVRRVGRDGGPQGYQAEFKQQIFFSDTRANPSSGICGSPVAAVTALLVPLRGHLIGSGGPPSITVPEFLGVEEAVKAARRGV